MQALRLFLARRRADRAQAAYLAYMRLPARSGWNVHVATGLQRQANRAGRAYLTLTGREG